MTSGEITLLVIAVCLIPLAGLFGAMDAALQRVSKARVDEMRRDGVKRAGVLSDVVAERARHVALLLLLRIACEMVAATLVAVILYRIWGGGWQAVLVAAGVMTVVSYVLVGDIVDAYERWDAANDQRQAPSQQQPVRPSRPRRQGS